jgi:uncharacterized repeat protein (TIGR01451 family)
MKIIMAGGVVKTVILASFPPPKDSLVLCTKGNEELYEKSQVAVRAECEQFLGDLSMKDQSEKNAFRANVFLLLLLVAMSIPAVTQTAAAKSLYVIADINSRPTPVHAYDIGINGSLAFQAQHDIPYFGVGAVGLAIDSDSGYLFVTYENSDEIQLVEAKTMTDAGATKAPDASDLAGIVYDHEKGLLYCVDRRTRALYVYDWDPNTTRLTHESDLPVYLEGKPTAYGIALDEIDDLLYVASATNTIYVYSTFDWSLVDTISVSRMAISVAVDPMRGFLYFGAGYMGNKYLTQYNLFTDTETEVEVKLDGGVESDAGVIGLGVDPDTGLVYVSTGIDTLPGGDDLRVYDISLNQIGNVPDIGNPTGLVIPGKELGYNPLNLSKGVIEGAVGMTDLGKIQTVGAGGTITYSIYFEGNNDVNNITGVTLVDTLPRQVSFVEAIISEGVEGSLPYDPNYDHYYDPNTHTYTWLYESLSLEAPILLKLRVRINQNVIPGTTITNWVEINCNETPPTTKRLDVVTTRNPLNLSKEAIEYRPDDKIEPIEWVDIGDTFTYRICVDNNDNPDIVNDVNIVDALPYEVNFVEAIISVDDEGSGEYDPNSHTYKRSYLSLAPGEPICLELVVQVKDDPNDPNTAIPGTTIINSVLADSNETPPSEDEAVVTTYYKPLYLSKSIVGNVDGQVKWVDVGDTITYSICFDNNNDLRVTNVSIRDRLPKELSFESAKSEGKDVGHYDSGIYEWSGLSLEPGEDKCLELVVKVKDDPDDPNTALPGTTIVNKVEVDSDETKPSEESVDVTTYYKPLNLSKSIVGSTEGQPTWVDVGDAITYRICFDNDNDLPVTNVSIIDTLPDEVSFESAKSGGKDVGYYDSGVYEWSGLSLGPGEAKCLELVVRVNQGTASETKIENKVEINCEEAKLPTLASVVAKTPKPPREIRNLSIIPNIIRRMGYSKYILAVVPLPKGESIREDVRIELSYYPDTNTDKVKFIGYGQFVTVSTDGTKVLVRFDRAQLMKTVPGYGRFKLKIKGRLKSGRSFYGEPIIYITRFMGS